MHRINLFPSLIKAQPKLTSLMGYPPYLSECFELLKSAGAENAALFGGAIRDADYAARYNQRRIIKDYDFRVWLPSSDYEKSQNAFIENITKLTGVPMEAVPCPGTNKVHYSLMFHDIELDISIRPVPSTFKSTLIPIEAVAIDRARDSDVGLCSVAIDPSGRAWAMPEYLFDQINQTITVYPSNDEVRIKAYLLRMQSKFPDHRVIVLDKAQTPSLERPGF